METYLKCASARIKTCLVMEKVSSYLLSAKLTLANHDYYWSTLKVWLFGSGFINVSCYPLLGLPPQSSWTRQQPQVAFRRRNRLQSSLSWPLLSNLHLVIPNMKPVSDKTCKRIHKEPQELRQYKRVCMTYLTGSLPFGFASSWPRPPWPSKIPVGASVLTVGAVKVVGDKLHAELNLP